MSLTSRSALSRVESESGDLAAPVRARLAALCAEHDAHARFLNTLSLLEHIGGRKIMASQSRGELNRDTLKHLAEETRHAFFFKRAAEKFAGKALDYGEGHTLAGGSARQYMGRLDAQIADALGADANERAYLYMSLIVELRAVWFYRLYRGVLEKRKISVALGGVLAEEELHLAGMLTRLGALDPELEERVAAFSAFEDRRFRAFWREIERQSSKVDSVQRRTAPVSMPK